MKKKKIVILGIGGVGGYVGGFLADKYAHSNEYEVVFIARGEHGLKMKENGLLLKMDNQSLVVKPDFVTDDLNQIGEIDILICATKSYDLIDSIQQLQDSITNETIILPLLNGVDSFEKLKKRFPQSKILNGCIFIVSKIAEPGTIEITGTNHYVCIGSTDLPIETVKYIYNLFEKANLNVRLSEDINKAVWEKYIFIASLATLTTLKDRTIGQILENKELTEMLIAMMSEVCNLAKSQQISISDSLIEKYIESMKKMPFETTTSMHRDQKAGKQTEIDSLSNYVIQLGKKLNIETKAFEKTLIS
ncbi:MAG: ketopantoate reductase family protein [Flavobacteriia bacterium]|nr:ketopantoate reductase family protein [Flavobacteriia bacterium]